MFISIYLWNKDWITIVNEIKTHNYNLCYKLTNSIGNYSQMLINSASFLFIQHSSMRQKKDF